MRTSARPPHLSRRRPSAGARRRPSGRRRWSRWSLSSSSWSTGDGDARRSSSLAAAGRRRALRPCSTGPSISPVRSPRRSDDDSWLISTRFPSPTYLAGAAAAAAVGKPWLSRSGGEPPTVALLGLVMTIVVAGTAGAAGAAPRRRHGQPRRRRVLVAVGAPNRRPSPPRSPTALGGGGLDVTELGARACRGRPVPALPRHAGRRPAGLRQGLRRATAATPTSSTAATARSSCASPTTTGRRPRSIATSSTRRCCCSSPIEAGVALPATSARSSSLPDGSMVLAMDDVGGRRSTRSPADEIEHDLLDAVWREVAALHRARLAHRALRAANIARRLTTAP